MFSKTFGPSNLRIGQIWEYRDSEDIPWGELPVQRSYDEYLYMAGDVCRILDIRVESGFLGFPTSRTVLVKFLKSRSGSYRIGDQVWFVASNFDVFFRLLWDSKAEDRYGVYCGGCGQYYDYAKFDPCFKCWACRNGWTT